MSNLSDEVEIFNIKYSFVPFKIQELSDIFGAIDADCSNNLTLEEVVLFLKSITDDISESNIEKIFHGIDESGDRKVDFDEFKVKL